MAAIRLLPCYPHQCHATTVARLVRERAQALVRLDNSSLLEPQTNETISCRHTRVYQICSAGHAPSLVFSQGHASGLRASWVRYGPCRMLCGGGGGNCLFTGPTLKGCISCKWEPRGAGCWGAGWGEGGCRGTSGLWGGGGGVNCLSTGPTL